MTMGLVNAPMTWSRFIASVMDPLIREGWLHVYFDDNLVATDGDMEDHCRKVIRMMDVLQQHQLRLRPKKAVFGVRTIEFLGHEVGDGTIRPTSGKTAAIAAMERPRTVKQLQSVIGCCRTTGDSSVDSPPSRHH